MITWPLVLFGLGLIVLGVALFLMGRAERRRKQAEFDDILRKLGR